MSESKTVSFRVNVWAKRSTRMIHIAASRPDVHSTVSNDPKSKRYHPNLFGKLRRVLTDAGRWPEGM